MQSSVKPGMTADTDINILFFCNAGAGNHITKGAYSFRAVCTALDLLKPTLGCDACRQRLRSSVRGSKTNGGGSVVPRHLASSADSFIYKRLV
ncbi:hypothetical protein BaRGS_00015904 [Batillaria attramentaria]|uniref:Uncharacterized protein n=1 Tax=Batillaria attramentaria TaxID=370345 RepID=A0ABD0L1L4_9CAEN